MRIGLLLERERVELVRLAEQEREHRRALLLRAVRLRVWYRYLVEPATSLEKV